MFGVVDNSQIQSTKEGVMSHCRLSTRFKILRRLCGHIVIIWDWLDLHMKRKLRKFSLVV